jgi:hypothetical protein
MAAWPMAQVRLTDETDRDAFRSWFTFLADAQFYRPTPDVADCAGLVRHAVREALRAHTPLRPAVALLASPSRQGLRGATSSWLRRGLAWKPPVIIAAVLFAGVWIPWQAVYW